MTVADELRSELLIVARQSSQTLNLLEQHNFLPEDFPLSQTAMLLKSLAGLPRGSLDKSPLLLQHAITRLSDLRRNFFEILTDNESSLDEEEEFDGPPSLQRGDALDRSVSLLITDASTALDAYRQFKRNSKPDTSIDSEIRVIAGDPASFSSDILPVGISEIGILGERALNENPEKVEKLQKLSESAFDTRNSVLATKSEVTSNYIIAEWAKKLRGLSLQSLRALRISLNGLKAGTDTAQHFYQKYRSSISRLEDAVFDELETWLNDIIDKISKAEDRLRSKGEGEELIGVIRQIDKRPMVIAADGVPYFFDIASNRAAVAGTLVGFNTKIHEGRNIAYNLRRTDGYVMIGRDLFTSAEARKQLKDSLVDALRNGPKTTRQLRKQIRLERITPASFWKPMGHETLHEFVTSLPDINVLSGDGSNSLTIYSLGEPYIEIPSEDDFLNWAINYLQEVGGTSTASDLALRAREEILRNAPKVPAKAFYEGKTLSEVLSRHDRIWASGGEVILDKSEIDLD